MTLVQEAPASRQSHRAARAWKTVLVHVEPGRAAAPRLETAIHLARKWNALLIGLGAEAIEPMAFADPFGSWDAQVLTAMRQQVQDDLRRAERAFKAQAAGIRHEWRRVEDRPAPAMARVSRSADIIVAGGCPLNPEDGYRSADAAELALLSGRPVLVAPPKGGALQAEAVVVAWKDAREARRALADALPLLIRARDVLVVEVCGESGEMADAEFHAREVAEGLKRHGVAARSKARMAPDDQVVEVIEGEASAIGADLIVAGCYGHSRMNEWLFGGVSRSLLRSPQRFVLTSH